MSVTPERRTHVRFDIDDYVLLEPAFSIERHSNEIARSSIKQLDNTILLGGGGFCIRPYWEDLHFLTERTETDGAFLSPSNANATVASGILEKTGYRAPLNSEMSNVVTGASANLSTNGYKTLQKSMAAGADWSANRLSPDQTAYPAPDTGDDNIVMDRVLASTGVDTPDQPLLIGFYISGGVHQSPSKVLTVYFNAYPGWDDELQGSGRYALVFCGDGRCKLYEANRTESPTWTLRTTFRFSPKNELSGRYHCLTIYKKQCGQSPGNLWFRLNQADGDSEQAKLAQQHHTEPRATSKDYFIYTIPKKMSASNPMMACMIRVDCRRDLKGYFTVAKYVGPTEGTVRDDIFEIDFPPSTRAAFYLQWQACTSLTDGTEVECKLYDAEDDTELTMLTSGTNYKTYEPSGSRAYYVKAFLTGTETTSPFYKAFKVFRNAVYDLISPGEQEFAVLRKVDITGAERDLSHESASVTIANLNGDATLLSTRASICTSIETEYDSSDSSLRCKLFRGYANRINSTRRGVDGARQGFGAGAAVTYPANKWKQFDVEVTGYWQRLYENVSQIRQQFIDYSTGQPMKVTDALRVMFNWCGIPDSMIDFPDLPIRLFSQSENSRAFIEPLTVLGDAIMGMINDYLAHFLVFDPNAGDYGKYRLIAPSSSPYTNVTAFTGAGPGAGKEQMNLNSYAVATSGGGLTYATNAPTVPILKGTFKTYVKPPEANLIVVSTVGQTTAQGVPSRLTQVLINPVSYNFGTTPTADPDHPDYLGRCVKLFVMNPAIIGGAISNEAAIHSLNWVARRVYDLSAHAVKMAEFQAPLALIDHDEAGKKRHHRYYDPVTIDAQQFLIRNCNPAYVKDHVQVAMYQCEAPRF